MDKIEVGELFNITDKHKYISDFTKNGNVNIEFEYLSNFINTKILRDYVRDICFLIGLHEKGISRLILIIDELNNNAIEYGSNIGDLNKLRISIKKNNDYFDLKIEVEDSGKGKKAKKALDMETLRAHQLKLGYNGHESIRGRGLFMIIVNLVDRLYFRDSINGGLIVGIKKKLHI